MNMKQIETSLQQLFNEPLRPEENRKVVFWYDYDEELVNVLQVCVDAGAKRILIPAASVADLQTVPADLLVKFQPIFLRCPQSMRCLRRWSQDVTFFSRPAGVSVDFHQLLNHKTL